MSLSAIHWPSQLRRIAPRVALLFVLGAATALPVAAAVALFGPRFHSTTGQLIGAWQDSPDGKWLDAQRTHEGVGRVTWQICAATPARVESDAIILQWHDAQFDRFNEQIIPRLSHNPLPVIESPADPDAWRDRTVVGLPFGCLSSARDVVLLGCMAETSAEVDMLHVPAWCGLEPFRVIPLRVHWLPLAANAGVYGAAWWAALFIPGRIRNTLRHRRGCCPHCAYDLRGLAPGSLCPECGRASANR